MVLAARLDKLPIGHAARRRHIIRGRRCLPEGAYPVGPATL